MQHTHRTFARKILLTTTAIAAIAAGGTTQAMATQNHLALSVTSQHVKAGKKTVVYGTLTRKTRGTIRLQYKSSGRKGNWKTIKRVRSRRTNLLLRIKLRKSGYLRLILGKGTVSQATRILILRPASASWYGPGLYGNKLACGGRLTRKTVAIAHRTLPCGTRVLLVYGNRKIVARVRDRGPYAHGRDIDLTAGAKKRLKFGSLGTVWMRRL